MQTNEVVYAKQCSNEEATTKEQEVNSNNIACDQACDMLACDQACDKLACDHPASDITCDDSACNNTECAYATCSKEPLLFDIPNNTDCNSNIPKNCATINLTHDKNKSVNL